MLRDLRLDETAAVVQLLKSSLGESSSPKTIAYWHWKHVANPFGPSPVMVAEEDNELAAVRAFMQYKWQLGQTLFDAVRAVDTATHPSQQGKGFFKKLTMAMVAQCIQENKKFVFNTPNESSKPGYLKMGWQAMGKVSVCLKPILPGFSTKGGVLPQFEWNDVPTVPMEKLCAKWNSKMAASGKWFVPRSVAFLQWRYHQNPVQQYFTYGNQHFYLCMYIKRHRYFSELRISELIWDHENAAAVKPVIWACIRQTAQLNHALLLSCAPVVRQLLGGSFVLERAIGPILTVRKLYMNDAEFGKLKTLPNSYFQLGDLELF